MNLFDSHCHFDFDVFQGKQAAQWADCRALGVNQLLIPGVGPENWAKAQGLSTALEGVYYAVGLHPWFLNGLRDLGDLTGEMTSYWQDPKCVAVGECGLDASIETPLEQQVLILEQHLALAQSLHKPLILHVRGAHNELISRLREANLPAGGVIHAYTGSLQQAEQYWSMGFHLGVGGAITYERARKTRAAVAALPLESLLLETDAPDMPLSGHQGEANHPGHLPAIARSLASLRTESLELICQQTTANSEKLFGIL